MSTSTTRAPRDEAGEVALVPFTAAHLDGALALSRALAWPFRFEEWAFALRVGQGFALERAGAVIGSAFLFPYGDTHAAVGLIIVADAEQGRGHGARLMDALLQAAHPRAVILNATPEGRPLYERRGFVPIGEIRQHQAPVTRRHPAPAPHLVRPMAAADLDRVARLDREATGMPRRALIERLAEAGEGQVLLRGGEPVGYAITRPFGRGHVIGPVVAPDLDGARLLIEAALSRLEGCFVRIDTPLSSGLAPWLASIGLPEVSDGVTMLRGDLVPEGPSQLFGLASQSMT